VDWGAVCRSGAGLSRLNISVNELYDIEFNFECDRDNPERTLLLASVDLPQISANIENT
jgi:hypothetical protein